MKDIAYPEKTVGLPLVEEPKMTIRDANVFYGEKQAIYNVELDIAKNEVLAMIGPSGCGKSTLLRCLNRMNDTIVGCPCRRRDMPGARKYLWRDGCCAFARARRHGIPETESISKVYL
jgi:hypothetical protein